MIMRMSVAVAAVLLLASAAQAGPPPGGNPTDPGNDPVTFGEDPVAGPTGVGSTGTGLASVPTVPAGAAVYATTFNGEVQGGITAQGVTVQPAGFSAIGQVFHSSGGTLDQISFVDTNGAAGGEVLQIMAFDPTNFTTVGSVLFSSGISALTGYGDGGGTGGVDALAYHTWSDIDLSLTAGLQYYAFVTPAAGSNIFDGSNSRYPSGAYFFGAATADTALGGELVFVNSNGGFTKVDQIAGRPPIQALYQIAITPAAAVPEPASWAMMVGGFGVVGAAMRRRRRTAVRFG